MPVIIAVEHDGWKTVRGLKALTEKAIEASTTAAQRKKNITILFTNDATLKILNRDWRGKNKPTNVLSFPAPEDVKVPRGEAKPLGDVALSFETIQKEADAGRISLKAHATHMIVHGVLHLLGYDHLDDTDADVMEKREVHILAKLGLANPYL